MTQAARKSIAEFKRAVVRLKRVKDGEPAQAVYCPKLSPGFTNAFDGRIKIREGLNRDRTTVCDFVISSRDDWEST